MKEYYTSDLHFGHDNIIGYCNRPFRDADHMNKRLINEINMKCKREDTLIDFGDWCCYGKARGVEGMRNHASFYEDQINCKIIHIIGNHDKNNKVKGSIYGVFLRIGNYQIWGQHRPPWDPNNVHFPVPTNVSAYICGHVHDKFKVEKWNGKWVINVGCDVWNYRPVSKQDILRILESK